MNKHTSIAIDGPSGVGKTTIAKRLAGRLGFVHVDTGAMFRTLAVYFIDNGIDINDEPGIAAVLSDIDIEIKYVDGTQHMLLNGEDVTDRLRTEDVSRMASVSSQYAAVRVKLLELQRKLAATCSVIMDGRDIGTVVLPVAALKIFLTADPGVRALRRYKELEASGKLEGACLENIENDLKERDLRDSTRDIAPLRPAADAVIVDTSDLNIEEVEERIANELDGR